MSKLPDFLVCGFQKCATTALYKNLPQHPKIKIPTTSHDICQISQGKEFNFFKYEKEYSTNFMGLDWYKSHFKDDGNIWGEVSPTYSDYACFKGGPADLIKNTFGDNVKLIFTIRNPIYRTLSVYNHYLQLYKTEGITFLDFNPNETLKYNVENNYYDVVIEYDVVFTEFIKRFSRQNILIVVQEKLSGHHYQSEYNKIFNFLGLNPFKIDNKTHHSRGKVNYDTDDIKYLSDKFFKIAENTFSIYGSRIKEWKEFC